MKEITAFNNDFNLLENKDEVFQNQMGSEIQSLQLEVDTLNQGAVGAVHCQEQGSPNHTLKGGKCLCQNVKYTLCKNICYNIIITITLNR